MAPLEFGQSISSSGERKAGGMEGGRGGRGGRGGEGGGRGVLWEGGSGGVCDIRGISYCSQKTIIPKEMLTIASLTYVKRLQ